MTWSRHELGEIISPRLVHLVTWSLPTTTKNAFGEASASGSGTSLGTVPASVEPLSGREYLRGEQMAAEITHRVWMRFLPGLSAKCVGAWTFAGVTVTFEVILARPVRGLTRWMEVMCKQLESP
jgi:head-tail adaptor